MTKKKISKLFDNKVFWAVVSLLAALFIWVYITGTQEEPIENLSATSRSSLPVRTRCRPRAAMS